MGHDVDFRIQRVEPRLGRLEFRTAHIRRSVNDLSLKIAEVDRVEVDDPEGADPGRGQIQRDRRAEAAGADTKHPRRLQLQLPLHADLRQDKVAAVACDLVVAQRRDPRRAQRGRVSAHVHPRPPPTE